MREEAEKIGSPLLFKPQPGFPQIPHLRPCGFRVDSVDGKETKKPPGPGLLHVSRAFIYG